MKKVRYIMQGINKTDRYQHSYLYVDAMSEMTTERLLENTQNCSNKETTTFLVRYKVCDVTQKRYGKGNVFLTNVTRNVTLLPNYCRTC